jgi:pimeloyl-ACP methyl ester carboxylesterase
MPSEEKLRAALREGRTHRGLSHEARWAEIVLRNRAALRRRRLQDLRAMELELKIRGLVPPPPVPPPPDTPPAIEPPPDADEPETFTEFELTYDDTHPAWVYDPESPDFVPDLHAPIVIKRPLILVPGFLGSKLWIPAFGRLTATQVWPPVSLASRSGTSELERHIVLEGDGLFPGAYEQLKRFLNDIGYVDNVNFWIFAYDWRRSNEESGTKLADFIVKILTTHPQWDSVDIVNHSMGGLVTRKAYKIVPDKIRRIAYLASPHYGSPKAYFFLHPEAPHTFGGTFMDIVAELAYEWVIKLPGDPDDIIDVITTYPRLFQSVFELLCDRWYFRREFQVHVDWTGPGGVSHDVRTTGATYLTDVCQLQPADHDAVKRGLEFKHRLGGHIPPADEANRLIVYSKSEATTDRVQYNEYNWLPLWDNVDDPYDSGQRGDGTVPSYSARAGLKNVVEVSGDHCTVPNAVATFRALRHFLTR